MSDRSDLLMLHGVVTTCADCGGERIFLPADDPAYDPGAHCCTGCDAAVFLLAVPAPAPQRTSRVA